MHITLRMKPLDTVYVEIYAGTFFPGCESANFYACTNIRGSAPDYSILSLNIMFTLVLTFAVRRVTA